MADESFRRRLQEMLLNDPRTIEAMIEVMKARIMARLQAETSE